MKMADGEYQRITGEQVGNRGTSVHFSNMQQQQQQQQ